MSDLLTVREVARIFRVDDTTVKRWIKQGTLEAVPRGTPSLLARFWIRRKERECEGKLGEQSLTAN